jgi:predicted AlkP superfamily phosphohydrolase/phosphomutase
MAALNPPGPSGRRVLLLGLDSATWALLRPWTEAGALPTLGRAMAGGAWGVLRSTTPPVTPIAWTSMVTGVRPGRHGVLGFTKLREGTYEREVFTSADRRRPAIWTYLSRAGLCSIVVDVPFTFPPEPIEGVMVSGMGTPSAAAAFVQPPSWREAILRACGDYPFDLVYHRDPFVFLERARRIVDHRFAVTRFLLRETPWAFAMLVLMAPDRIHHYLWHHFDPAHPRHDPTAAARVIPAVRDFYRHVDDALAGLWEEFGTGTDVLVVSDHGSGTLRQSFSLTRWLMREGYTSVGGRRWGFVAPRVPRHATRGRGRTRVRDGALLFEVGRPDEFAGAVFRVEGLDPTRTYAARARVRAATPGALIEFDDLTRPDRPILGGGAVAAAPRDIKAVFRPSASVVELFVGMTTYGGGPPGAAVVEAVWIDEREDWTRTRAFLVQKGELAEGSTVRLNVRGREPQGIVEPGAAYERLREEILGRLRALRDPAGRPLVGGAYRWEDVFAGPYGREAADLLIVHGDGVGSFSRDAGYDTYDLDAPVTAPSAGRMTGGHHPEGVIVACGPRVARGVRLAARIEDIAPTVLALLGVPVPDDLDGRVLTEALADGATAPEVPAIAAPPEVAGPAYTDADREEVERRLRRLGYLD